MLNIVLVEPEIPGNTGNIGRTCVGNNAALHLVGKLGFSLRDKYLKRSGLDYWPMLDLKIHPDWDAFLTHAGPGAKLFFFEKDGARNLWDAAFTDDCYLIFGSETRGFPPRISREHGDEFYRIPMTGPIRSLNLAAAAAVAAYEAIRQTAKMETTHGPS